MDKREFVEKLKTSKRVVVKIGSGVVSSESGLNTEIIENIAENIVSISKSRQVVIVSSGAVAGGLHVMGAKKRPANIVHLQAFASIGQPVLMRAYSESFKRFSKKVAQVLITVDDIQNRRRFINAKNTILTLLKWKIIPIVNENDTVVIKELRFGDNDILSFHVSNLCEADALIILSNVDGVYSNDPSKSGASLIEKFDKNTQITAGKVSRLGSGGIETKIEACLKASKAGKLSCIINGKKRDALKRLFSGELNFTFFEPSIEHTQSKKSWIETCNPSGVVVVDNGAKESLFKNKSLLPSGIVKVFGGFSRGDIINIEDSEGNLIAKGITNYDSSEIERIKGHHSERIAEILGYKYSNDVVHIDNMVVMGRKDEQIR